MNTKILTLGFILLLCVCKLFAQTIHYDYDDAGNRTKRYITLPGKSAIASDSTQSDENINKEEFVDWLDKMKITVYPNPTQGNLSIEIANLPENPEASITVYTIDAQLLQKTEIHEPVNKLDFTPYPSGVYILRITSGPKKVEWKIVKQ